MTKQFEECIDCKWYDDVLEGDSLLYQFGDEKFICAFCAETRGVDVL